MLILVSEDNSKCRSCLQVPVSSQSQAVAGSTELLRHRGDESDLGPFWHHRLTHEIKEPDLAQKAGYFPPLRRVVWSVVHPLERGERLPDDLQHLLRVKVRSDTLSCDCAELDQPDRAPSFPCSNGCRRKACTRWNGRRCCWKEKKLSLYLDSVLGSYNFAVAGDWLTGAWFSQQNWWSRLRSGPAWPHSSPGHVGDS